MLSFETGWAWINKKEPNEKGNSKASGNSSEAFFNANITDVKELHKAFARCFAGKDGERVLAYLKKMTFERPLSPDNDNVSIWHLEGQRYLTAHIASLIERGRKGV
ncbi:MAG: hypothetical protein GY804_07235 [Alphaproteobacteria bacterium]|nr:hypothetical protein [Alphaproteobacteria bacterium]